MTRKAATEQTHGLSLSAPGGYFFVLLEFLVRASAITACRHIYIPAPKGNSHTWVCVSVYTCISLAISFEHVFINCFGSSIGDRQNENRRKGQAMSPLWH